MRKLVFVVNVDWFFVSHRLPVALEAKKRNFEVTIVAIETDKRKEIESYGFKFIPIPTSRSGTDIIAESKVLFFLLRVYKEIKPDIIHHVGVKPVTYGSIAAKLLRVPKIVNALSGMGYLFINKDKNVFIHRIVMTLFKFGFKNRSLRFILQNKDDLEDIKKLNVMRDEQMFLIRGSGVDLLEFKFSSLPGKQRIKVLLPSRMLWDKGVGEFVEAAKILRKKYSDTTEFILAGGVDTENNSMITEAQLLQWQSEGNISWLGFQTNMSQVITSSDIVVLPSYREGLPKSLIEACAIGRPIVTTDVPGCREVVVPGENGFLVPAKNSEALAIAIEKLLLNEKMRKEMGVKGRHIAEQNFSIDSVIEKTFAIYNS